MPARFPSVYDRTAASPWARGVVHGSPVGDAPVTLGFREQDINHGAPGHSGTDLAAAEDTDITCLMESVLYDAKELSGQFGNYVVLRTEEMYHLYAHMKDPLRLPLGSILPAGTVLGQVGMTGFTTGPHLHWMCSLRPDVIYSAQPLLNPLGRCALPPITWNDILNLPHMYQINDEPEKLQGSRQVVLFAPNPPVLGPVAD